MAVAPARPWPGSLGLVCRASGRPPVGHRASEPFACPSHAVFLGMSFPLSAFLNDISDVCSPELRCRIRRWASN